MALNSATGDLTTTGCICSASIICAATCVQSPILCATTAIKLRDDNSAVIGFWNNTSQYTIRMNYASTSGAGRLDSNSDYNM